MYASIKAKKINNLKKSLNCSPPFNIQTNPINSFKLIYNHLNLYLINFTKFIKLE